MRLKITTNFLKGVIFIFYLEGRLVHLNKSCKIREI